MSKIDDFVKQLCPDGVEMVTLEKCTTIERGKRVTKGDVHETGLYPVISGGVSPMGFLDVFNRNPNTITVSQYGTAGYVDFQTTKFWANDICYSIFPNKNVCNRYLWYNLKHKQNYIYRIRNTDATPFSLPLDTLKRVEIPIPPLPIQEEIARILDKFTSLIDKIDEEITLRQKQYEYYREKLLTFEDSIERVSFGNSFQLKARIGWQGLTKKEYRETGEYKLVTGTDFTKNHTIDFSTCVFVDKERYDQDEYIQLKKDDILITKDGTLGKVAYISHLDFPTTLNGGVFVVRDLTGRITQRFTMHYLCSYNFKSWMERNHTSGSIQHLTQKLLVNFMIPVPSLDRQQEIVTILDKFESIIQKLKEVRDLRQKQYEYYREKLLTF